SAVLQAIGERVAFVVAMCARAAVGADDELRAVDRQRAAEEVPVNAAGEREFLLVAPGRAATRIGVDRAGGAACVRRADCDDIATDIDRRAEAVVADAIARS